MNRLNELRMQGTMIWNEVEHGWVAAPEDIVKALSTDGSTRKIGLNHDP